MVNIFLNYLNPKDPEWYLLHIIISRLLFSIKFTDVQELDKNMRPGNKSAASLFLGMLVDARKFRAYDNRESV